MRRYLYITMMLLLSAVLWGCEQEEEKLESGQYYLYYADKDGTGLTKLKYTPEATDTAAIAEEMLQKLGQNTSELEKTKSIPPSVSVNKLELEERIAEVTFSESYHELKGVEEIICRSSIVLTLMQLEAVDGVRFFIGEKPLTESSGQAIGVMTDKDFVDTGVELVNNYVNVNVTLYYADESGKVLRPFTTTDVISKNTSIENYVVEQLIQGPEEEGYYKTMSDEVKLISVNTKDGICYVNFTKQFLKQNAEFDPTVTIYSIVNSLAELSYVTKVQILIEGDTNIVYQDSISLQEALMRNLDCVEPAPQNNTSAVTKVIPEIVEEE